MLKYPVKKNSGSIFYSSQGIILLISEGIFFKESILKLLSADISHRNGRILYNTPSPESILATVEATHFACHQKNQT